MKEEITLDFSYIDDHLYMIENKIKKIGTISMFNGLENRVFFIKREIDEINYYYIDSLNGEIKMEYEEVVSDFMRMFKNSMGKMTVIYRVYMNMYNKNTGGEFRELWGDILYINGETYKLCSENIKAEYLSKITMSLNLTDEEIQVFGKPEDYIFKDDIGDIIMGIDLV